MYERVKLYLPARQHHSKILFAALMSLFAGIALMIAPDSALVRFDSAVTAELQRTLSPTQLTIAATITHIGDGITRAFLAATVTLALIVKRQRMLALGWFLAVAGSGLFNGILKSIFQRERPLHAHGIIVEDGFSFPSGHASGAMATFGMLAFVAMQLTPGRWHLPILLSAGMLIAAIGLSRVVLQVHYGSDVLAGFAIGAAWLMLCIALIKRFDNGAA